MTEKPMIASAYFASDDVIFAVRRHGSTDGVVVDRKRSAERKQPGDDDNVITDLRTALDGMKSLMQNGETFKAVILICPGPFRTIDKNDSLYGFIGRNAEVPNWRQKNVLAMFQELLIEDFGEKGKKPALYIYNQAGATAVGEFMHRYGQDIRNTKDKGDLLQEIGSHLFVVADTSIDAALMTRGEPYHGLSTMNVGHHAIYPKEDPAVLNELNLVCHAHPNRPCLNSLASLNAIKARWKGMSSSDFKATEDAEKLSLIAFYIAQMLANVTLTATPARIVIGGRIRRNQYMVPYIREHFRKMLSDAEHPEIYPGYEQINNLEDFIVEQDDDDAGVKGGLHVLHRILTKLGRKNISDFNRYVTPFFPS